MIYKNVCPFKVTLGRSIEVMPGQSVEVADGNRPPGFQTALELGMIVKEDGKSAVTGVPQQ